MDRGPGPVPSGLRSEATREDGASKGPGSARAERAPTSRPRAGAVWTEERSDEGRRRLKGPGVRASGASANITAPGTVRPRGHACREQDPAYAFPPAEW